MTRADDAARTVLAAIAAGEELHDIRRTLIEFHEPHRLELAATILGLAADALEAGGASRANPVAYEDIRERYLPEREFVGNTDHQKSRYALHAAAMIHGGVEPDLDGETGWWHGDDLWTYALYALVILIRAAADRSATTPADVARQLAATHASPRRPG